MKRSSNQPTVNHVAKVTEAWGDHAPDWIVALAEAVNASSLSKAGKRISYSASSISQVLSRTYRADTGRMEEMVRGAFMAATVTCPELGEMARHVCVEWQKRPYSDASSMHIRMWRACKECPLASRRREEAA